MICIIHGYLLDGSGSNLWTRSIVQALCREGEIVHLVCQEPHPASYDFIAESYRYHLDGSVETMFRRDVPYSGRCIMHKPQIGDTLPVYVWDHYEEFSKVVPMIELPDEAINYYLDRNTEALMKIVIAHDITAMHVNHAVLMSVAVERAIRATSIPFAIMPHGSDIEYAIRKDDRFLRFAIEAFTAAKRVFVVGREMRERVNKLFASVPDIDSKMTELNLGVDTSLFETIPRKARQKNIREMLELIAGLPRGKSAEMSRRMIEKLRGDMSIDEFRAVAASTADYCSKRPDSDLEAKLATVNWDDDKVVLFVGRFIASKGLQSILTALPLIFGNHHNARLIAVGHGPLREALEAFVWALRNGELSLVERIVEWGSALEDGASEYAAPKPFTEARRFYDELAARGELDKYLEEARRLPADRVIFTGYLSHRELRYLFPCSDIAIFPSVVAEAGPLVFLEALASGCFPLGTYFAGMAASIDAIADSLPVEDAQLMKLSAGENRTVADIATKATAALSLGDKHKATLQEIARRRYDWKNIARDLALELRSLTNQSF